jgi:hypothetical protein
MRQNKHAPSDAEKAGAREGHLLLNIGKTIFLIAVLVAFWFFFDWWLAKK